MRFATISLSLGLMVAAPAEARPEWADPLKTMTVVTCRFLDPYYINTPCTSAGKPDSRNEWRQHLGTDFRARAEETVVSPVNGTVVVSHAEASRPAEEAYLVIRDAQTQEEHVLGHVQSSLAVGSVVKKGDPVATVRDQGLNTHFHWGFNTRSVTRAMQYRSPCLRDNRTQSCSWGWGKAPYEASRSDIVGQGWANVL